MKDKYVLDSSVWIALERGTPAVVERILPLIEKNRVCLIDVIVAEVLRGVKSRKDFTKLKNAFSHFTRLSTDWEGVAELAFEVSRAGFYPPLIDVYIAQCVKENGRHLITQDKDFVHIAKVLKYDYELI